VKHPANPTAHLAEQFLKLCNKMKTQITTETTHWGNAYLGTARSSLQRMGSFDRQAFA